METSYLKFGLPPSFTIAITVFGSFKTATGNWINSQIINRSFSLSYVAHKHASYEVHDGVAVIKLDSPGSKVNLRKTKLQLALQALHYNSL